MNNIIDSTVIAVAGFAKTGQALLDFLISNDICREKYKKIYLFNDYILGKKDDHIKREYYEKKRVEFLIGKESFARLEEAGVIILSPGINGRSSRFDKL